MPYASENFKTARLAAGLPISDLAKQVGRSESHLRNVERGKKPMLDVYLSRIAKVLGVALADLIADPPDQPREQSREVGTAA